MRQALTLPPSTQTDMQACAAEQPGEQSGAPCDELLPPEQPTMAEATSSRIQNFTTAAT